MFENNFKKFPFHRKKSPDTKGIGTASFVRCEDGFKISYETIYASMLAYVAFFSINSRRGATSSPISMEKM